MRCLRVVFTCALFFAAATPAMLKAQATTGIEIVASNSNLCLQANGASTGEAAGIVQEPCGGASSVAGLWSLVAVGSNYHIVSTNSGMCLNVDGASTASGAPLIQWPCQSATAYNDQWTLVVEQSGANPTYHIVSAATGMCANVWGASTSDGAYLAQYPCQSVAQLNDQFSIQSTTTASGSSSGTTGSSSGTTGSSSGSGSSSGGTGSSPTATELINMGTGECLQALNAATTELTPIVQEPCVGTPTEQWTFQPVGSYYHIVSANSGMCLNVQGNSTANSTPLIQWPCQSSSSYNDQWSLVAVQGGASTYYHIVSRSSGQCANVDWDSTTPGESVIQWPCQIPSLLNDQFYVDVAGISPAALPSVWTPVITLPVNPIGVANLPNGNLMMWSAYAPFSYEGDIGPTVSQTYYATFNPATQTSSAAMTTTDGADHFCPGTAVLPNGNILINGGSSSDETSIYNWSTGTWTADADMNIPRGYEADTVLSTGSVYTMGGSWSGGEAFKNGEVWTAGQGWTILTNTPDDNAVGPDPQGIYRGDNHMWMFAQSQGTVFQAGPSAQMNWITTGGTGSITSAGNRGSDAYSINGNAVLYDIGKILKVAGAPTYQQDTDAAVYATNSAYTINIAGGPSAVPTVTQLNPLSYLRAFSNSVVLPSGDVVVVGGQAIPNPFTDTSAVLVPELWNHNSQLFSLLNPMQTPRTYHSTAILLTDGRVFVGGGGQCGTGCAENHLTAEILTPPYLLNADGSAATQPVITGAPTSASLGQTITVTTNSAVTSFSLMRLSATTHTVNNDQRRIPLTPVTVSGTTYSLTLPSDPGVVLPGYYMLFALNSSGVPSVSTSLYIP